MENQNRISILKGLESCRKLAFGTDLLSISYPDHGYKQLSLIEEDHFWFIVRRKVILEILRHYLPNSNEVKGLEVGCGTGYSSEWLSKNGYHTAGFDAREIHRSPLHSLGFIHGDIFAIEPEPEFDFLLMLDVIEHIENDRIFFQQALKFVKPNGFAIISVPALKCLWSNVDENFGHYRRYSKTMIETLARSLEIELQCQFYFYGSTLPLYIASRLISKIVRNQGPIMSETSPPTLINFILGKLLETEMKLWRIGGLPGGSSLFAVFKKV